ncbi:hypothetical protein TSUD_272870 [Trifolium subterraneum]|uniref:Reverse transcriptase zinc-binding domain-containing protein n=1 Tax=Trifolium subterraneum TaxID=3900 RepID=A0A2Z6PJC7_TRISU|nr:hypothetical protein TSUD_272870 [Trifolium subterraneum]
MSSRQGIEMVSFGCGEESGWEEDQYQEFLEIIASFVPSEHHDRWLWLGDGLQGFTANSAYLLVVDKLTSPSVRDPITEMVFKFLWKCGAPSKVRFGLWYELTKWLGLIVILPHNLVSSLAVPVTCANNKR